MVDFPRYAEARHTAAERAANPIVHWRDIETDLKDLCLESVENQARELAYRINERHYRKSKALFDTIQEYRELRATKNRNDHDKL